MSSFFVDKHGLRAEILFVPVLEVERDPFQIDTHENLCRDRPQKKLLCEIFYAPPLYSVSGCYLLRELNAHLITWWGNRDGTFNQYTAGVHRRPVQSIWSKSLPESGEPCWVQVSVDKHPPRRS